VGAQRSGDGRRRRRGLGRQVDVKCRPLVDDAFDIDRAAGLLDDAVDHRQSEAGAAAFLLGGEKRLEDAAEGFRAHAGARIGDRHPHIPARLERGRTR
jgi:hypothetical protein